MARYPDFVEVCGYGDVQGIGGANCRHSFWPYIEGVSERTYTDKQLESMKPENRPKIKFEGREYDDYQATQKQREIEREIRKQKRRKAAYEAAGLTDDAAAVNTRLRRLNVKYREFSRAAGLPEQWERARVYQPKASTKTVANAVERGILKDTEVQLIPVTEDAIQRVPLVLPGGWSEERAIRLQEAHRELLRYVRDEPLGTETGAVYSADIQLIERTVGTMGRASAPFIETPHIFIHNHPSGQIFSATDIESFIWRSNLFLLTAVGHNGNIYAIEKTDGYAAAEFVKAYAQEKLILDKKQTLEEYAKEMSRFLEGASKYGVQFIRRR